MRTWTPLVLLLTAALAGCAGSSDGQPDEAPEAPMDDPMDGGDGETATPAGEGSDDPEPTPATTNSTETSEPEPDNVAPVPAIEGPQDTVVGASVVFNLTAEDPDGDALSWTLSLDGEEAANGTELPAVFEHAFDAVGSYTFVFNVTDGEAMSSANLTLDVAEPEPALVIAGSSSIPINPLSGGVPFVTDSGGLGAISCAGFVAGENGLDCYFAEVPAELGGHAWVSSGDTTVEFWDACDATGGAVEPYTHAKEGTIPDGTGCAVLWFWGSGGSSDLRLEVY